MLHTKMDLANIRQGSWSKKTSYCTFHLYETSMIENPERQELSLQLPMAEGQASGHKTVQAFFYEI